MESVLHHKTETTSKRLYKTGEELYRVPVDSDSTMVHKPDRVGKLIPQEFALLHLPSVPSGVSVGRQNQVQSSLKALEQALANARANDDRISEINLLKRIGLIHCKQEEYAWGIKRLEQALQIAKTIGDRTSAGVILTYIGAAYRQTGQHYKALRLYLQALVIFRDTSDRFRIGKILYRLGEIYNHLGEPERAHWCSRQALKRFQDLGNLPDYESAVLHNIGEAYLLLGRVRSALAFFEQALTICHRTHNHNGEATTLESIGTVYVKLNQDLQALKFYQQALQLRRMGSELPYREAITLDCIGAVYYKLGNYPLALRHHLRAMEIRQALYPTVSSTTFLSDTPNSEKFLQHLVAVYDCLGLHDRGEKCYQQALEIIKTFGDNPSEEAIWNYFYPDVDQSDELGI